MVDKDTAIEYDEKKGRNARLPPETERCEEKGKGVYMQYRYSIISCAEQIRKADLKPLTGQQKKIFSGEMQRLFSEQGKSFMRLLEESKNNFVVQNWKLSEEFTALLILYDKDGFERHVSFHNRHIMQIEMPHQGWYHKHEFIEVFYVVEGSFSQILFGERRIFEAGEFMIADQNCEHADYIEAKDAAVLFLQIRSEYLDGLLRSYDGKNELQQFLFHSLRRQKREQSFLNLRLSEEILYSQDMPSHTDQEMDRLLGNLFCEDLNREPGYEDIRRGLLIRILQRLCTNYTPQLHTTSQEGKEKELLYEVERYIRLHAASVTASDLEAVFHYHRNYYNLLLKKYREVSFREYVLQVRLSYARQLLEQTKLPVCQIARQVGYENTSHFYHLFQNVYGIGPKEMRERKTES